MNTMQKGILALLLAVLLGGLGYFVYTMVTDDEEILINQSFTEDSNEIVEVNETETQTFNPVATTSESFVVQLEAEDSENSVNYNGTVSYDGEGNYMLEGVFQEDRLRFYDINGEFISCQNDTCYSLATGENGVDTSTYAYSEELLDEYKNDATYAGRSDCPAGTCDTWNVTREDSTNLTFYVADDGKISKAEGTVNSSTFIATFTYQPVTIQAPDNVLPSPFN